MTRNVHDSEIIAWGRDILDAEAAAVNQASRLLDESFARAVRLILDCRGRVCVTGVGKAGLIGQKIHATLASTGTHAYSLHPVEALHGDIGMVHGDDVVLGLSKSGSAELVALLPRLRELGCKAILITGSPDCRAAQHTDVVLNFGETHEACPLRLAPSSSAAAMLGLGDALALTVMKIKDVQPDQYARFHPAGALGRFLLKAGEVMRTGPDCPTVSIGATLADCYRTILAAPRRAGAAIVVDEAGTLAGIITHGDFFRLFEKREAASDTPVADVMTRNPKCVMDSERVTAAIERMRRHGIDELPVVDEQNRPVGLIDIQDLIARGFSELDGV